MKVRDFEVKDKEAYIAMSKAFYESEASIEDGNEEQFITTFKQVMKKSPYVRGLLLEQEGAIIGYALLGFFWCNGNESITILIDELYIKKAHRGKQYGRKFFTWLEKNYDLDEYTFTLEVNPRNEKALSFYTKLGYKQSKYIVMEKY
ncbi:GNAT superfamily N-acetyltransferase [Breznakia sp. PF5-3]|uniref:GNAT family N-acetyltransferase n=1 Tax=unclassified Breznakia TaxID=2623764 RepID=UPI0024069C5A|nr:MULTISPECIES: GNAT family N-acetyltransferase [unclassified Breznakia]MDL2276245.1 GNAT family N-acetyltransferase [Breznakia sp. OttesenSCG-928-G09]MDF9824903.1 GNAT superfamily N-acetyltransferase [Breznakia sp. PM6-1]MDF9835598.1 GNAT superfamily N-acetyltransferase [Breznakia sp. PF5-3]MDF9837986.1 GNAT superfamily N-acetyltransferase [Breznakia sp. PFB2-8]MDF9859975.1 GNAT superfamily N-acetyltransferase [Breznakia sp. PH5-24]